MGIVYNTDGGTLAFENDGNMTFPKNVTIAGTLTTTGATTLTGATTMTGVMTFNSDPVIGAGKTINLDSSTATLSSNAATITKYACQITTESLTTAAEASQAFTITFTGIAATDLAFVQHAGGTNTRAGVVYKAACTTDTITVTVTNVTATNAFNGTLIFNLWVLKA